LDKIVAGSMSHSEPTAQSHYRRPDKVRNNAVAQVALHNYWSSECEAASNQQQPTATTATSTNNNSNQQQQPTATTTTPTNNNNNQQQPTPSTATPTNDNNNQQPQQQQPQELEVEVESAQTDTAQKHDNPGYCFFEPEDVGTMLEEFGDSPTLSDVRKRFHDVEPKLKSPEKMTPEKICRKLKRLKESPIRKLSEVLPKKFWPKRMKKYTMKEYEVVYAKCWMTNQTAKGQIRGAVEGTIMDKYSDMDIYSILQAWKKKVPKGV
jgi:hypothetical protein